jgi:hypothetical protein
LIAKALAEQEKKKKETEAKKPVAPKNPLSAMPLNRYAGKYFNEIYSSVNISVIDNKLVMEIGPKKVKLSLIHWEKDIFSVNGPKSIFEHESGFASFQVDPQGKVSSVILDFLNQDDDLGIFKRIEDAKVSPK